MLRVGLTGSIGMGKSTTASMFDDLGIPVHDADKVVHQLYQTPAVAAQIEAAFPGTTNYTAVDRVSLGKVVFGDPKAMKRLEEMIHPLVRSAENEFSTKSLAQNAPYVIFDIPLLFETNQQERFDAIIVVSADLTTQRNRVLARAGMTTEKFKAILAKQLPDEQKRVQADFIVNTDGGLDDARKQVAIIHQTLCKRASALSR